MLVIYKQMIEICILISCVLATVNRIDSYYTIPICFDFIHF